MAISWFTGTVASAARFYYEDAHATDQPTSPTTAPLGVAMFAGDFRSIRAFADRDHAGIVSWNAYDAGRPAGPPADAAGHYAAHEDTDLLVGDIRRFFASLS